MLLHFLTIPFLNGGAILYEDKVRVVLLRVSYPWVVLGRLAFLKIVDGTGGRCTSNFNHGREP